MRVTWARVDVNEADRAIDGFRLATLPTLAELDGFSSASLLADRDSGFGVVSVTFDSADAMRGNRQAMDDLEAASVRDGVQVLDRCHFDLVLAHLRVPELV